MIHVFNITLLSRLTYLRRARGVIFAKITPISTRISPLARTRATCRRHVTSIRAIRYSKFPGAIGDILRYLPRISRAPVPPRRHGLRSCIQKQSLAPSWIISTSPGTSWRRQCGGFIHRSVYFRFILPLPVPLPTVRGPHLLLHWRIIRYI